MAVALLGAAACDSTDPPAPDGGAGASSEAAGESALPPMQTSVDIADADVAFCNAARTRLAQLQDLFARIGTGDPAAIKAEIPAALATDRAVVAAAPAEIAADAETVHQVTTAQLAALDADPTRPPQLPPDLQALAQSQAYLDASARFDEFVADRCGLTGE